LASALLSLPPTAAGHVDFPVAFDDAGVSVRAIKPQWHHFLRKSFLYMAVFQRQTRHSRLRNGFFGGKRV